MAICFIQSERAASETDAAGGNLHHKEQVIAHQPASGSDFHGGEVHSSQNITVRLNHAFENESFSCRRTNVSVNDSIVNMRQVTSIKEKGETPSNCMYSNTPPSLMKKATNSPSIG